MKPGLILGVLVLAIGVLVCQSSTKEIKTEPSTRAIVDAETLVGTWGLVSVVVDGKPFPIDPRIRSFHQPEVASWITFFPSGRIEGALPCNTLSGEYVVDGSTIQWEVISTASFCLFEKGGDNDLSMITEDKLRPLFFEPTVEAALDHEGTNLLLDGGGTLLAFRRSTTDRLVSWSDPA